ncbi:MAG: hypothetical protein ACFFE4_10930 [Candidatus Thorarchaeota archaeon]
MTDDIEIKDGKMYGGWRAPENLYRGLKTSIHDDGVAQKVGMRGGTIPGTIHLSLFAPICQKLFGNRWFEKGTVSMYYTYATIDKEEVRAIIELPEGTTEESLPLTTDDVQFKAWGELKSGQQIMTGTISIGNPKEPSYLQAVELKNSPSEELRILEGYKVGDKYGPQEVLVTQEDAIKGLPGITDRLEFYKSGSPWGKSILSPTASFGVMTMGLTAYNKTWDKGVPFFGATEVRYINGPIFVDTQYISKGEIACAGVSRKTEYYWLDATLEEKETGKLIASMRHMNRYMKAGSPVYPDQ